MFIVDHCPSKASRGMMWHMSLVVIDPQPPALEHLSHHRAKIAAMANDPINAALWALASYDPALVHFAELRETLAKRYPEDHELTVALSRVLTVYLGEQCTILCDAANVTAKELEGLASDKIGDDDINQTLLRAVAGGHDGDLMCDVFNYGLCLGLLTAHGIAPWNRMRAVIHEYAAQHHPSLARR